jgi:hypothetical protein
MILFRTHRDTPYIRERLAFLQQTSGMDVVCAFDETSAGPGLEDQPRIALTHERYRQLGLRADADVGWRCGDYPFYVARQQFPDVSHFWMIEYDVLLSYPRASDFFDRFRHCDDVDFLTAHFGPAPQKWYWRRMFLDQAGPVYRCFFPVTRLSTRAIDFLLGRRQAETRMDITADAWPNDEVFVATTLARAGFNISDMNRVAKVYDNVSFNFDFPRSYERSARKVRHRLMHPVLTHEELATKIVPAWPRTPFQRLKRYVKLRLMDSGWSG